MRDLIWAYNLQLGTNMGDEPGEEKETSFYYADSNNHYVGDAQYRGTVITERETWNKVTDFAAESGLNTLVIDLAEAVQYETHPEFALPGAWSRDEIRAEVRRLKAMGLNPVPKLNFSATHNVWMGETRFAVGTDRYNKVCAELIDEVCDLFDHPSMFHLGMDEENPEFQQRRGILLVRNEKRWFDDVHFLIDCCEKNGARPWMMSDGYWNFPENFSKEMPKSVLLSNAFYGHIWYFNADKGFDVPQQQSVLDLDAMGYDQIVAGSTWAFRPNVEETVSMGANFLSREHCKGFVAASFQTVTDENVYGHMDCINLLSKSIGWYADKLQ